MIPIRSLSLTIGTKRGPNAGDLHGLDRRGWRSNIRPRRRKIGYVSRAAGVQDFVERAAARDNAIPSASANVGGTL